jgi:trimethylamine:corrinoid methyltransferase-like protein
MAKRLTTGVLQRTNTLATEFFEDFNFKGDFLKQRLTRELFPQEQFLPSAVIDRDSIRGWQQNGKLSAWDRACLRTKELLTAYQRPSFPEQERELHKIVGALAATAGMKELPGVDG